MKVQARMTTLRAGLRLAVPAALFAAISIQPAVASARCKVPPLELLWSYPANGDANVPTNAQLWTLSSAWIAPNVLLDGAPIPSPTIAPSSDSASDGACSVTSGTGASRAQGWYLLMLAAGLVARLRRVTVQPRSRA